MGERERMMVDRRQSASVLLHVQRETETARANDGRSRGRRFEQRRWLRRQKRQIDSVFGDSLDYRVRQSKRVNERGRLNRVK